MRSASEAGKEVRHQATRHLAGHSPPNRVVRNSPEILSAAFLGVIYSASWNVSDAAHDGVRLNLSCVGPVRGRGGRRAP